MKPNDGARVPLDRWRATWQELGAADSQQALFDTLIASYSEPHRRYHTLQHLEECLAAYAPVRVRAQHPAEIELALWFHDAIYDVRRDDNEERSAEWARTSVERAGLAADIGERIAELVMATKHGRHTASTRDAGILVDVDLSILGAERARFDEYERQVREEYAWVPESIYQRARRKVVDQFLARPRIYSTDYFYSTLEARARDNLERSIASLRKA